MNCTACGLDVLSLLILESGHMVCADCVVDACADVAPNAWLLARDKVRDNVRDEPIFVGE